MEEILWTPDNATVQNSQMNKFRLFVNEKLKIHLDNYNDLYNWSVKEIPEFWASVWEYFEIIHSQPYAQIVDDSKKLPGAKWFVGTQLNFAGNLLRYRDNKTAFIFKGENQLVRKITYEELYQKVSSTAYALIEAGVKQGDRVAGFIPNMPETVIAMLATASIGAVWSSASPDFGIKGVLDRFTQIKPKIIFTADGYFYNGKKFDLIEKLKGILNDLHTVEQTVVIPYTVKDPDLSEIPNAVLYDNFCSNVESGEITFLQLPFDHPLYIMYSSGTTGLPKSIVHGAGGTLIQHLKELRFHTDLTRDDTIFYFTTCGWMMWNWLVSSLSVGATVVLYDGSPFYPDKNAMWRMTEDLGITVFGTSAKFIAACKDSNLTPGKDFDLSKLRAILSTGSPLVEENFDYVYSDIKNNVQLFSISGGTDIISCFALGNPTLPVYRGELQCKGLGMDVHAFDSNGNDLIDEKGELVCTSAFPSMPVYFWNDPEEKKYHNAYFNVYPDVWCHGDYIEINDHGGVKIFGRSDATVNPSGVRIGTAEIYRAVELFNEIEDSLAVGQIWNNDERVILFVKLGDKFGLTTELTTRIKTSIRFNCSPKHVPAIILPVDDIPYTTNMKKVEIAVKKIIHGEDVTNRDALINPESLELYKNIPELKM
tara:strand:- start:20906 stop:22858 length:1953 start_codon:yes stop_codon:yes gene_type:complete